MIDPDIERFLDTVEDMFARQTATRNATRHAVVDLNAARMRARARLAELQADLDGRHQS
ncbi:hypothetical protein [Microbispora sp. GKU 823]|uniref:hypothetical protein n=1 Tax=Microbispora sp. GKU 823 TaxID=1652100 RepID=UPI0015C423FD|nr:hypothetical protein [Microbispora sp. GKU 823]